MNGKLKNMVGATLVATLLATTFSSCKKEEKIKNHDLTIGASTSSISSAELDKLLNFFAWTVQVPKEKVKFNADKKEFNIVGTDLKETLERVQKEYAKANIYKLSFEQK